MKVLIVPDKFKGSLDAIKVCEAIEEGLLESGRQPEFKSIPMADGGEGTCDMLTQYSHGKKIKVEALDPFFRKIQGEYGISGDGETAFIEMANVSGLQLLKVEERNALLGTTYGTGQLIAAALDRGVQSIILGVGGSATNDAGIGMGEALGAKFYDDTGNQLKPIGQNLKSIRSIDVKSLHPRIKEVSVTAICDVSNPFYGIQGAAHIFGPQKGASPDVVRFLDDGLVNFAAVVQQQFGLDINFPGAGAGGGLGGGAKIFFDIQFESGIEFIMAFIGLDTLVRQSDLIVTGEGKMDEQTLSGKVVKGVADLARKYGKPLIVIAGKNELSPEKTSALGIHKAVTLVDGQTTESEAFQTTYSLIKKRMMD
ncbi:MAG TPA: glycerate kinase, partial [Chryseolinea sp.]|nr:glycerate kinase [Chryseolinea sp.]